MSEALTLSEFADAVRRSGPGCWFLRLEPHQQEKIHAAHEAGYSGSTIARVIKTRWGFNISDQQVRHHLTGSCSCQT